MLHALFLTLHKVVEGRKMSQNTPTKIGIQTCRYFISHRSGGSGIFKTGGANPKGGANLLFGQFLPKNCMKMEKLNQKGGMHPCAP